ncbi:hypothetical protein LRS06_19465 [Hymenobacter sp. J193]|uniref:hypothetical protein n=1 Tax=Hymenobacter sp. J193 TaxID=2898429 RepID=UPI0021512741|nr:hypothetical protein [Hymenobacter sp. J193]MCR5889910.1 hypothetical protein [Hymenobacter sp. J193]
MGLDYSYVLFIKRSEECLLLTHLSQHGSIEELEEPFGTCVTLDFPLDKAILAYHEKTIRDLYGDAWPWRLLLDRKNYYPQLFPTDDTGRVGCIYLDVKESASGNYCFIRLKAATSCMSRLFQNSPSIRSWFLHLSSLLKTEATFLDMEEEGYHFIYRKGNLTTATVTEDLEAVEAAADDKQALIDICLEYDILFF